jgi:outer membrane protein OmpA-like peptidoglycan-associated protein
MAESFLSFGNSESFRKQLLVRNLPAYNVPGSYTSPGNPINYETNLTVTNVVDSPNNYVSSNIFATELYPLNEFGPEGGFGSPIGINSVASTNNPEGTNQGPYYPVNGSNLDIINEFYIESAYVTNKWGPSGGYKDLVIITDIQNAGNVYQPYWDPGYYNYSTYPTFNIVFQDDPVGSNGPLSQDTYLAQIGASQLKFAFNERVSQEIQQATIGIINLDTISDPFSASLLATGQQPFFIRDWRITVPENPVFASVSLANRLTGTYFPVSFIPGDYFDDDNPINKPQTEAALGVANSLTGGLLAPIMNKYRNPSEIFVENTGNGTRSALFSALDYNLYRPAYNRGLIGGLIAGASAAVNRLFDQDKAQSSGYYVGSENAEPAQIDGPPNQLPVNQFGVQQQSIVYGPQELGILYEGNEESIKFGLKGRSYSDGGGITGQLVWTSPKYKGNAGFRATAGGGAGSLDDDFNQISADYLQYQSTDVEYRPGSILYETQRLVDSADQVQGQTRLKHVGTAINQVSKVFNDGYKEITKGSSVLSYVNQADGTQAGLEYCRVFQKDTPYYTFADLQKTDGITKSGRRFDYSVFDNTYNLNIAPMRNPGSTNIVDGKVKKYMFSLENLAWRTSDRPGFTYDDLPTCEKGPNGGRIMWFPPYDLKFTDDSKPDFNGTSFIGRPEPIYTYKNTTRSGSLNWTIIVDHPSAMNTIIEKQLKGVSKERIQSIVDSFFAGCTKYDLYELGIKFNTIPTKDLFTYQQILNNPRLTTEEEIQVLQSIPQDVTTNQPGSATNVTPQDGQTTNGQTLAKEPTFTDSELSEYVGYGFYFDNNYPEGYDTTAIVASQPYNVWYNQYIGNETTYIQKAPKRVQPTGSSDIFSGSSIPQFFTDVIKGNFEYIQSSLIKKIDDILSNGGEVAIDMVGSASATAPVSYNDLLSQRRNDSVRQWFLAQTLSGGTTINTYAQNGKFKFNLTAKGETISIPQTKKQAEETPDPNDNTVTTAQGGNILTASINCTQDIKNLDTANAPVTSSAQVYSIPAMACRRVFINKITAKIKDPIPEPEKPVVKEEKATTVENVQNVLTQPTQSARPEPQITVEQKIKDGISKKILRNLFSECDYFQVIKETDPMVYDTIADKIKFFNPAFHSMTPEGLNSRLTFLHQCTRPGQTIPIIGPDGRPKYNDALNTSFGAPPVLVLRIGDFFHTKIIPTSLGLSFEDLDLNPEGIGIQPMIAKVTMGFNIIGGMGLKEPVQELQNALSFNYYANTEIYDERATATEDTSKMDKYVVEKLTGGVAPVSQQQQAVINSVQPKLGQSTMGTIVDATTMDYAGIYSSLEGKLQEYFKTFYDSLFKINNDYGYGALQIANKDRNYVKGFLSPFTEQKVETQLYGKTNKYQEYIQTLVDEVKKDIEQEKDPYLSWLKDTNVEITSKQKRELQEKLTNVATQRQTALLDVILNNTSNLVKIENELNYIFRQLDVIASKTDGNMSPTNEPLIYDLSGETFFAIANDSGSIFDVYTNQVKKTIEEFNILVQTNDMTVDVFKPSNSTIQKQEGSCIYSITGFDAFFGDCEGNRFFILMSQLYINDEFFTTFVNDLTSGNEIKNSPQLVEKIKERSDDLKGIYNIFQNYYKDEFKTKIEDSEIYKTCTTWKIPDNTVKTCSYVYPAVGDLEVKAKKLKDLYSNVNLNEDKTTFNGKVTFN